MTEMPNAFGGFAPFPNTIMIPTMGLQSAVIGYRFGFGYEQGKRTLRAMSNEEFNNLDEEAEQAIFKRHDSAAINYFQTEMVHWVDLQRLIIEKSVEIEVMKANRTPSAFREMFEGFTSGFGTQQVEDAKNFFKSLEDPIMKIMAWFAGAKADPQKIKDSIINKNPITGEPWVTPKPVPVPFPPTNPSLTPLTSKFSDTPSFVNERKWQGLVSAAKQARAANLKLRNTSSRNRQALLSKFTMLMLSYHRWTNVFTVAHGLAKMKPYLDYWNNEITKL